MIFEHVEDVLGWLDKYRSGGCQRAPGSLCECDSCTGAERSEMCCEPDFVEGKYVHESDCHGSVLANEEAGPR